MDGWVWWSLNKGGLYVVREVYEDLNVEGNSDEASWVGPFIGDECVDGEGG